jgi:phage gp29-like protein
MSLWSAIRAAFSGTAKLEALSGGSVIADQSIWYQLTNFAGNFSPQRISNIINQANAGNIRQLVNLAQEWRSRDGHIHGCFTGLELAVSGLDWKAVPVAQGHRGTTRARDKKLASQVEAAIDEIDGWISAKAHLIGGAEMHGHSTVELTKWGLYQGKNPLLRGWLIPSCAEIINANRFGFRQIDGALLFDPTSTGDVNQRGIDLLDEYPAGKFIQHRPRITGAVPILEGLSRMVAWYGAFRNWDLKDWLLSAESGWKPTRIITYKKGTSEDEDKQLAVNLARTLISSGGAAIPDSLAAEIFFPSNGAGSQQAPHRILAEFIGNELAKATLGHTLLMEAGDKGARSLGEVGFDVAQQRRDARAVSLAVTLNAMLIRPLVAMNVPNTAAPLYLPDISTALDLAQFATSVDTLAKRMKIPASWVYEEGRIREPDSGEECLTTGYQPGPFISIDGTVDPQIPTTLEVPANADPNAPKQPTASGKEGDKPPPKEPAAKPKN